MYYLGRPIGMKEPLHGTDSYITEVTVTSKSTGKFEGRLTIQIGSPKTGQEVRNWSALCSPPADWSIKLDGAVGNISGQAKIFMASWIKRSRDAIQENEVAPLVTKGSRSLPFPTPPPMPDPIPEPDPIPLPSPTPPRQPVSKQTLAALAVPVIKSDIVSTNGIEIVEVVLAEVIRFEGQPRDEFPEADHESMIESLKQEKQKQLIIITPVTGVPGKKWMLVDGERRFLGALAAGIKTLMAVVRHYESEAAMFWDAFIMNMGRKAHTPYEKVKDVGRALAEGHTVQQICKGAAWSNCAVYQLIQLQHLEKGLLELMRLSVPDKDRIGLAVAKVLSRVPEQAEQVRIWEIAKREKTPGLRKLKVEDLAAPFLSQVPVKFRKRQPSDNAVRMFRLLGQFETGLKFLAGASAADVRAFQVYVGTARDGVNPVERVQANIQELETFRKKLAKTG